MADPSTSAAPALTASVIVHDDFSHIGQALRHLCFSTARPLEVVVTINRGLPDEVHKLRAQFPDAQLIINPAPRGFAANHNAVMQSAETPFIVLLNDDALLQPGALDRLLDYLESHPDCGIVGPVVRSPDGNLQISAFSDPTLLRMLFHVSGLSRFTKSGSWPRGLVERLATTRRAGAESLNTLTHTRIVPVIAGVCMVVRREAVQQAGLMDEDTLMYGEEFGWQRRLRQMGWHAARVGETEVIHLNLSQDLVGWKLAEHRKGMLNYFVRYQPQWQAVALRAAMIFFHALYALVWLPFDRLRARSHWSAALVGWQWQPTK